MIGQHLRSHDSNEWDAKNISLNVRGLNDKKKRLSIFRWLKQEKCDIAFLQETFSNPNNELDWQQEWEGECIFVMVQNTAVVS